MVEGAPLLREYGFKAHRGFESLPLRQNQKGPEWDLFWFGEWVGMSSLPGSTKFFEEKFWSSALPTGRRPERSETIPTVWCSSGLAFEFTIEDLGGPVESLPLRQNKKGPEWDLFLVW